MRALMTFAIVAFLVCFTVCWDEIRPSLREDKIFPHFEHTAVAVRILQVNMHDFCDASILMMLPVCLENIINDKYHHELKPVMGSWRFPLVSGGSERFFKIEKGVDFFCGKKRASVDRRLAIWEQRKSKYRSPSPFLVRNLAQKSIPILCWRRGHERDNFISKISAHCGAVSAVLKLKSKGNADALFAPRDIPDTYIDRNPRPILDQGGGQLSRGNFSLPVHNAGLLIVNNNLRTADSKQEYSQNDFSRVRPNRGLPMAAGWAVLFLSGWIWANRHDYWIASLVILVVAVAGTYTIIILASGL